MPETPKTQTAAPPIVPPKRPIVGTSLADDADARRRQFADFPRQMDDIQRDLDLAAALARVTSPVDAARRVSRSAARM